MWEDLILDNDNVSYGEVRTVYVRKWYKNDVLCKDFWKLHCNVYTCIQ